MYPGQRQNTYSNGQNSQWGQQQYQQQQYQGYNQQYASPQGQQQGYQQQYSRPSAAPPQQYSSNGSYRGNYSAPNPQSTYRPPSQPQAMGNTGMSYQYSQCTGQRKALIIGINYTGTKNALRGCINDANAMRRFLIDRYGYKSEDIVLLTDDQQGMSMPTKNNVLRAMQWLVSDAKPNDSLVFHYSGHGGLEKNLTGEEESGYDSCIYPIDFESAGSIIDDVMHQIMIRPLPQGARLTAFFDSCHSGSALDLPFVYSTKGVIKEANIWKDVGMNGLNAVMSYASGNIGGVVSSLSSAFSKATQGDYNRQESIAKNTSAADVIMISGSKDDQTSADATANGLSTGAMSYAFISVMAEQPQQTYLSLLNNMRSAMAGKYSQKPQLSASHPIDTSLQFIM